jgi:putative transcriptional regulator
VRREDLIERVRFILIKSGFTVSNPINMRSISFDMVARKDGRLIIVKVLSNVDAFSKDNAEEMKVLAEALEASTLLIGERSGSGKLETGIVYSRFSIPIVSLSTLRDHLIEEVPPFIFAAPGGLYVRLDSDLLKRMRETEGISLGTLAEVAGVSRRTIQMYEGGMGAMIDAALRLEEFLKMPILTPIDPFDYRPEAEERKLGPESMDIFSLSVFNVLRTMGYSIVPTIRCPFEALTKDNRILILTGLGTDESKLKQKAQVVSDLSRITGQRSVIFVERIKSRNSVEGTALVGRKELQDLDDRQELFELVISRSEEDEQD